MTASLPDAPPENWVDRLAPARLRPWLRLGRFDRPVGIWLLMLPGWQGVALAGAARGRAPDAALLLLFLLGAALMRAAGCAFNDIVDRDFDARVARTAARPIPAGQITVRGAWIYVVLCALGGLIVLIQLNTTCLVLGVASLGLVAAYPFMKRITWWPQAWLGMTFNWGALMGFAAAQGGPSTWLYARVVVGAALGGVRVLPDLQWPAPAAWLLWLSGLFWTLGYDTIYALQDMEDDALIGVKSTALRLGRSAPIAIRGFYAVTFVLAVAAGWSAGLGPAFYLAVLAIAAHFWTQTRRLRLDDPSLALSLFRSNVWAGVLLFVGFAFGAAGRLG